MILRHLGLVVLGAAVALAGAVVHREAAAGLPWGLALVAAASVGTGVLLRVSARPRQAASYAVGWLVVFSVAALGRPEGDYVLVADLRGYAMMLLALVVVGVAVSGLASPSGEVSGRP